MPNYKKMYSKLFNEITDIIERLQKVQQEAEELYISEEPIELHDPKNTTNKQDAFL